MHLVKTKIRYFVLVSSIILSGLVYVFASLNYSDNLTTIRLTQIYALLAILYLYLAVIASPLFSVFPNLSFRPTYILARRALGVSAFWFAFLHANIAFFLQLQGFQGLGFLSSKYLIALGLSFFALIVLLAMTLTSFDKIIAKLGNKRWKMIHRTVYLAGIAVLIHALMLGTHYSNLYEFIPQITIALVTILLLLEGYRLDKYLTLKFTNFTLPKFGITFTVIVALVSITSYFSFAPAGIGPSLGIHAEHQKLAEQALNGSSTTITTNSKIPGLNGDRNRRYSVKLDTTNTKDPLTKNLTFTVIDASNGEPTSVFQIINEKISHLIIVDSTLSYFEHIHPEQNGNTFTITAKFPKENTYRVYIDFQPLGAIEQQFAFTLPIGSNPNNQIASQPVDTNLTKTFGDYLINVTSSSPLTAKELSLGKIALKFEIKSSQTGQPITDLKPYLGSFGHLVMINQKSYEYYHVHPANLDIPAPDQNGGPIVEFLPIGIYGPIKPGIYRIFGQFNHANNILVSDYTIEVK